MYPNFFTLNIPPQQAIRSLAASDTFSAPCVEPSTGEYRGWVTCSGLLSQLLRHAYPRLTSPDLISQEDVDAFLWELTTADDTHPVVDDFGKSRKKSSLCDLLKEDEEKSESEGEGKTDMVSSPTFKSLASDAQTQFQSAWHAIVRVGDDGDICHFGFDDTTLLDLVSRGLDCRNLEDKRKGDFEPGHRIAVFSEKEEIQPDFQKESAGPAVDAGATGNPGGESGESLIVDSDAKTPNPPIEPQTSTKKTPPVGQNSNFGTTSDFVKIDQEPGTKINYLAIVSQLDVIDAMVRDCDSLGTFPSLKTMEQLGFSAASWNVITVTESLPAVCVFGIMHNCQVSGVPVLDDSKRSFLGSVDVSDLRTINASDELRDLNLSVGEFLKNRVWPSRQGRQSSDYKTAVPRKEACTVTPNASLLDVMRLMSTFRAHRVYISDSPRDPPTGVCTATDVMGVFALDPDTPEGRARLTW